MDSIHIFMIVVLGVHVYHAAICKTSLERSLTLCRKLFHPWIPNKYKLVNYCCIVGQSDRLNLVICKGHAMHFQLEISCQRKINLADLVVRESLCLEPPDSSRQGHGLNLVIHESIWKNCKHAVRQIYIGQIVSFKCPLCNHEVTPASNLVRNCIVV